MITMTDLFCGAGGSTTGALKIPGVRVVMAANHSRHAIDTHQYNHPDTDHDCADISQVVPTKYPRTDILWASPECTNHTRAKGKKRGHGEFTGGLFATDGTDEATIRSRATMHDVARFAEHHRYQAIIVENVPDARWWGPEEAPGFAFDTWLRSVALWGPYEYRVIYLDSAHAQAAGPGARSRRPRMYVVFWRKGERAPDFGKWLRPYGTCPRHGHVQLLQSWKRTRMCSPERPWGVYGIKTGQYVYRCPRVECRHQIVEPQVRAAAEAIDFTLPAETIGERRTPLVANTMRKIRDGWERYRRAPETGHLIEPYMIELHGGGSTHRPASQPMSTLTAGGINHGIVYADHAPYELLPYYGTSKTQPATVPMPTLTTRDRHGLVGYAESLEQCRYRMIRSSEAARAMEFPDSYVFLGDRDQTIEMIGNAVTPNVGRDLVGMVVEALTGEEVTCPDVAMAA
ncbi:DNA cytosine methyltransferase [Streptomyces griseomycini]|uniref:DNA (cytosine-5-)-methyltransferase n=1 Tax=Streptomyces griseomycini TaxID=66895 RepID=A0A7W7VAV7_9ACTN|nr:DNA cytosine methyltransferase [Streptomyces griseomycini]MBB4903331.1 DNA (cytosine-5)-methyltransferase 1 [Streptomyces griseomycini]GGR43365.1 DNA cytosine methyltransferase [Streptomyces griseomycini]